MNTFKNNGEEDMSSKGEYYHDEHGYIVILDATKPD